MTTHEILLAAQAAKLPLALADTDTKNAALEAMAVALVENSDAILAANKQDLAAARGRISDVMLDRLALTPARLAAMAKGMREVAALPDPVGAVLRKIVRPNGLLIEKTSVPMGVIAIIYESRPNVTSDAAALALKAGSACVLRCGRDAWASCHAIVNALRCGLARAGLPESAVSLIEDTTHASANELMTANGLVDLLIPRGGAGLIRACVENATVPCIQTGTGICHIYVDKAADLNMAVDIIENAKTSRPSVCNAEEVCLVHKDVAAGFLPLLKARLVDARAAAGLVPVDLRLDERAAAIIPGTPAGEQDFDTEFLNYILAIAVVDDVDAAIAHIARHSTHHSEAIITADDTAADRFTTCVDSAAVYVNASTRFTDGGEFGLGCEMGISTQKLHARGPMGLAELCSYKYIIHGSGQTRQNLAADGQQVHRKSGGQTEKKQGQKADHRRHLSEVVQRGGVVEKPTAGDGHLLGVEDAAETVGVGDDVGKDVEVDQIARQKTAEKGRLLRGGDPGPQGFELVVQHVAGASRAAGAADLRKKRENHRTSYHNFHIL